MSNATTIRVVHQDQDAEGDLRTRLGMLYMASLKTPVEPGNVVVHNHVYPVTRVAGTRGPRYWQQKAGDDLVRCECYWAPELDAHYRKASTDAPVGRQLGRRAKRTHLLDSNRRRG